jgi:hypothetical protein
MMTVKRSLMVCYSQVREGRMGKKEFERMKTIAMVRMDCRHILLAM